MEDTAENFKADLSLLGYPRSRETLFTKKARGNPLNKFYTCMQFISASKYNFFFRDTRTMRGNFAVY